MTDRNFRDDGVPEITRKEHEAKSLESKRVTILGYMPGSDTPVRITANDNGDGTYSLKVGQQGLLVKPYDRLTITYTDSTKATISTIVTKLSGVTQDTITNTPTATVDDLVRT